jgi:predicted amidohydrolase YtcJ
VVLSRDILAESEREQIGKAQVLMTITGGRLAYVSREMEQNWK